MERPIIAKFIDYWFDFLKKNFLPKIFLYEIFLIEIFLWNFFLTPAVKRYARRTLYCPQSWIFFYTYNKINWKEQKYINLKIINILHDFINDEAPWRCFVQDVKHRLKRHQFISVCGISFQNTALLLLFQYRNGPHICVTFRTVCGALNIKIIYF